MDADFVFENHLSIALLYPMTPAADAWIEEHVQLEDWQRLGRGIVIEPRYVGAILEGLVAIYDPPRALRRASLVPTPRTRLNARRKAPSVR